MTVTRIVGFETGDTSEVVALGTGCSVVAAPGSGNAGAYAFKNDATATATGSTLVSGLNTSRLRCSFRFYVGANPGGTTDSFYQILLHTAAGALVADFFLDYDKTAPGGIAGWWFGLWDSTDAGAYSGNYVTPGSDPVLGWVTFEIDCEIGATSTSTTYWYTLDSDGIRRSVGLTGNGTDTTPPSTMNMGTVNIDKILVMWSSAPTTGGNEPFYIDDIVCDDAALPGQARVISRQFVSTTPPADDWLKSTASTIDTVWSNTPFSAASYARNYISGKTQSAKISAFSATQSGKGSGVIDANDVVLGWKHAMVAKAASTANSPLAEIGTSQSGSSTSGANITLTFSVAPVAGDVVIVWGGFGTAGAANPGISTAGYTNIILETATAARRFGVWYKVMGLTPDTNVVCLGSGTAGDGVAYGSTVLRQTDNLFVLDIAAAAAATGSGTAPNPPTSGASVTAGALALAFGAAAVHDTSKGTQSGYTALASPSANATRPYSTTASRKVLGAIGSNDDPAVWPNWTAASWVAATILIRPCSTAVPANSIWSFVDFAGTWGYSGTFLTTSDAYYDNVGGTTAGGAPFAPTLAQLDAAAWGVWPNSNSSLLTVEDVWAMAAYRLVSGSSYNDATAETAAATDAQSAIAISVGAVAESVAATDAPNSTAIKPVATAETAAIIDAPNSTAIKPVATAETAAATDAQSSSLIAPASTVAESAAASDATNSTALKPVATAESAAAADAQSSLWIGTRAVAETAAAADAQAAALARVGAVAESAAATDAQSAAQVHRPAVAETAAIADAQSSLWVSAPINVAETAAATDTSNGTLGAVTYGETVAESVAATDAQSTPAQTFAKATSETAAIADAQTAAAIRAGAVAETAAATDAQSSLWIGTRAVAETAAAADAQAAVLARVGAVAESAAATDTSDGTLGAQIYNKAVAETAAAADAQSSTAIKLVVVAETAAIADSSASLIAILKAVAESAIVVDASSAAQILVASVGETVATLDAAAATGPHHVAVAELLTIADSTTAQYIPLQPPREAATRARSINRAPLDEREGDVPARRGTQHHDRRDANLG
jgi:trimeric autotransporter adhesin